MAEIQVQTDVPGEPLIRVAVSIPDKVLGHDIGWLRRLSPLVGKKWPTIELPNQNGSGNVEIAANGQVTAVVFSAHYCAHCNEHVPQLAAIAKESDANPATQPATVSSSG